MRSLETGSTSNNFAYIIRRNKQGNLDPNGEYKNTTPTKTKVKYPKEDSLSPGIVIVGLEDNALRTRILKPFVYTQ